MHLSVSVYEKYYYNFFDYRVTIADRRILKSHLKGTCKCVNVYLMYFEYMNLT